MSSHPDAFPGEVEPRIISIAMTLLVGTSETLLKISKMVPWRTP